MVASIILVCTVTKPLKKSRMIIYLVLLSVFTITIVLAFVNIIISQNSGTAQIIDENISPTARGAILDKNEEILAIQKPSYNVSAWKPEIKDENETIITLSNVLDIDRNTLRSQLSVSRNYVLLVRSISNEQAEDITTIKDSGGLEGIHLEPNLQRNYPFRGFAEPFVGYVNIDNVGLDGIEYVYEKDLQQGNTVHLTLDIRLQQLIQTYLQSKFEEHGASYINAILLDAQDGAILSAVSLPSFDPNAFYIYSDEERLNRILRNAYEPGSVFKVFSISSLLETGSITDKTRYDASGPYVSADNSFQISDINAYGLISTKQIIQYSSNVGTAKAAEKSSSAALYEMLRKFGFGSSTGIAMNGENIGIFSNPEQWSHRSKATIAIGQEIAVTALQIVKAATAIANNGTMISPRIVDRIVSPADGTQRVFTSELSDYVISEKVSTDLLDYMYAATQPGGTARAVQNAPVRIAAKTGTAEIYDQALARYSDSRYVASILSIFPYDDPSYILYVAVHEPSEGQFYGGQVAAPIAHDIISLFDSYASVEYTDNVLARELPEYSPITPSIAPGRIPDFIGLAKRDVVQLAAKHGYNITMSGNGWVVSQDPPPDVLIEQYSTISLTFGY